METIPLTIDLCLILFAVGLLAGLVDSIAGGGGLIALPTLLIIGLPPQVALGTTKLQGSFGTLSASYNYIRKGQASLKGAFSGIIFTFIGASIGALVVQQIDPEIIKPVIPVLLFGVFIYLLFSKNLGFKDNRPKMAELPFYLVFGLGLGFYDGFFGPGTGSFWTVGLMYFLGANMTRAIGYTKIFNFTSNIVALFWFVVGGNVYYSIGFIMAGGQLIGARIGSNLAITRGARFIRPVLLGVIFLTIVRLMYSSFQNGA